MKVVIMAGGKGTRIAEVNSQVPKPMIPIDGKPILEYQIDTLRRQGYTDIILIIGHLGHVIQDYFGDGSGKGVSIQYIVEEQPLGTAGALYFLKEAITDDFLLLNGDIIFDVDIKRFLEHHRRKRTLATILTHPNSHPYDSGIIVADEEGMVTNWMHKEDERLWYQNRVNAGIHMLSPNIFKLFTELKKLDLDRDILKPLIADRQLAIYDSPEYIKDMGTPDRYYSVIKDLQEGKVEAKNLSNRQKAIFLDRDGTINKYVGFLRQIDDFELIDGVSEAVRMINESGYLAIVVTNQPVIARGEVSLKELQTIHNKMETLLGQEGAYVDDIFYCPHHPHKGYEGERPEYKIDCDCRKPKPGMLLQAAEKYNIDLAHSWMIGDGDNDVEAGMNAGCHAAKLGNVTDDSVACFENLKEAVTAILKNNN
ncbi:MAG: D-glycero-beta-D-manno-heptose 1,7-bisphosphate 7-phosphatase [Lachnospiraceae bacterium]|nr:D-glycero-beta-D-manno-heptose 1,7-bisphosphate 7-phosphatase [Lachnospiraceae bacterium]MBQ8232139.1 D-glycero-beta-D-manno-heptose 1,7-bisphosphate 7-phosphatase [Lachnospiraceae bacterium]